MDKKRKIKKKEIMNKLEELRKKGKTIKEISRVLNLPMGTVASLIRRGKIDRYCKKCGKELKNNERSFCEDCGKENALIYSREYMRRKMKKLSLKIKICPICKNKFITRRSEKIYCCEECAKVSWRENSRKWQRKNKLENKIYNDDLLSGFIILDKNGNLDLGEFTVNDFPCHGDLYSNLDNKLGNSNLDSCPIKNFEKEQVLIEKELNRLGIKGE